MSCKALFQFYIQRQITLFYAVRREQKQSSTDEIINNLKRHLENHLPSPRSILPGRISSESDWKDCLTWNEWTNAELQGRSWCTYENQIKSCCSWSWIKTKEKGELIYEQNMKINHLLNRMNLMEQQKLLDHIRTRKIIQIFIATMTVGGTIMFFIKK